MIKLNPKNNLTGIILVILALLFSFSGVSYSDGTDLIPDDQLLEAVSEQLGLPGEEITTYEMLELETLTAGDVKEFTGIRYAEQLKRLRLENLDHFAETDPLFELENIEVLEIVASSIESDDLEGLASLDNLEILRLKDNRIGDISPVTGLTGIRELHLADNELIEIEGLEKLSSLQSLDLSNNHLISVAPLAELKRLDYLDLSGNQLRSVEPLLKNEGLDKGDVILLHNNLLNFSRDSKNINNVKALKSRGIDVTCLPQRTQAKNGKQTADEDNT